MSPFPAFPTGDDSVKNDRVRGLKGSNHIPIQVRGLTDIQTIALNEAAGLVSIFILLIQQRMPQLS
jgi:hypothetical protein